MIVENAGARSPLRTPTAAPIARVRGHCHCSRSPSASARRAPSSASSTPSRSSRSPTRTPDRLVFITSQFPRSTSTSSGSRRPEYFELRERVEVVHRHRRLSHHRGQRQRWHASRARQRRRRHRQHVRRARREATHSARRSPRSRTYPTPTRRRDLSDALWQRMLAATRRSSASRSTMQGRKRTVVGVAPPGLDLHDAKARRLAAAGTRPRRPAESRLALSLSGRSAQARRLRERAQRSCCTHVRAMGTAQLPARTSPNDSIHRIQMAPLRDEVIGNVRTRALDPSGRGHARAAHRLRERRQPAARARRGRGTRSSRSGRRSAPAADDSFGSSWPKGLVLTVSGAASVCCSRSGDCKGCSPSNPDSIPRAAEIRLDSTRARLHVTLVAVLTATHLRLRAADAFERGRASPLRSRKAARGHRQRDAASRASGLVARRSRSRSCSSSAPDCWCGASAI